MSREAALDAAEHLVMNVRLLSASVRRGLLQADNVVTTFHVVPAIMGLQNALVLHTTKQIVYLDSLGWTPDKDDIGLTQQLLEDTNGDGRSHCQDWSVALPENVPLQTNSHSCGVHVCRHACAAAAGVANDAPLDLLRMRQETRGSIHSGNY